MANSWTIPRCALLLTNVQIHAQYTKPYFRIRLQPAIVLAVLRCEAGFPKAYKHIDLKNSPTDRTCRWAKAFIRPPVGINLFHQTEEPRNAVPEWHIAGLGGHYDHHGNGGSGVIMGMAATVRCG